MAIKPRWSVCIGGYPGGWDSPIFESDNPDAVETVYIAAEASIQGRSMTTVAIFDDHGEGEPLGPEQMMERAR